MTGDRTYLGDGVYIEEQEWQYKLYTLEGNVIYLGESEIKFLNAFVNRNKGEDENEG